MYLRPRIALATLPFAFGVVLHAACTPAELVEVVQVSSVVVEAGQKCLVAAYEAEQDECLLHRSYVEKAECVAKVRANQFWEFIKKATARYYELRCQIEPHKCTPGTPSPSSSMTPPSPWDK